MTKSDRKIGLSVAGRRSRLATTALDPGTASIQSPVSVKCLLISLYGDMPPLGLVSCYGRQPSECERYPRRRAHRTVKLHNCRTQYAPVNHNPRALFSREPPPTAAAGSGGLEARADGRRLAF